MTTENLCANCGHTWAYHTEMAGCMYNVGHVGHRSECECKKFTPQNQTYQEKPKTLGLSEDNGDASSLGFENQSPENVKEKVCERERRTPTPSPRDTQNQSSDVYIEDAYNISKGTPDGFRDWVKTQKDKTQSPRIEEFKRNQRERKEMVRKIQGQGKAQVFSMNVLGVAEPDTLRGSLSDKIKKQPNTAFYIDAQDIRSAVKKILEKFKKRSERWILYVEATDGHKGWKKVFEDIFKEDEEIIKSEMGKELTE